MWDNLGSAAFEETDGFEYGSTTLPPSAFLTTRDLNPKPRAYEPLIKEKETLHSPVYRVRPSDEQKKKFKAYWTDFDKIRSGQPKLGRVQTERPAQNVDEKEGNASPDSYDQPSQDVIKETKGDKDFFD